ncbi:hypothetical protein AUTU_04230 [Aureibacter tunicatorum]|nr:hypothetical protein AUTU_04230 [Aureibacter tunicatorum]
MSLIFVIAAGVKISMSYAEYVQMMPYAKDFPALAIKLIGITEILGVIGLNLPFLMNKFKYLSPMAAFGLALTMIGAVVVHLNNNEPFVMQLVFLGMLSLVGIYRYKQLKQG